MILIRKSREPSSLTQYRKQPYASYDGYKEKADLREALLRDQGYLCAYCMRRIENQRESMKIEHWKAQSQLTSEAEKLDFRIMLAVCDGCRGDQDRYTTCDEHRHNKELFVNPMDPSMMETIEYSRNGYIKSSDPRIDRDLNLILNLNCEQSKSRIVLNRKNVYSECVSRLAKRKPSGQWTTEFLQSVLEDLTKTTDGRLQPFIGVIKYVIVKHMRKCK